MLTLIRNIFRFFIVFSLVSISVILLMDQVVMPLYVRHGQSITLQDVTNMPLDKATRRLATMGLEVIIQDSVTNPVLPPNTVMEQNPKPGTNIKEGRAVFLVITKGKEYVQMPNLIGKALKSAKLILSQLSLNVDTTEYVYDYDKPKGVICRQSIHPGMLLAKYSDVIIWISNGPPVQTYDVPDLFGLSLDAAKKKIREAKLSVGQITYIQNSELTPYTVIGQQPIKYEKFFESIPINLEVTKSNN